MKIIAAAALAIIAPTALAAQTEPTAIQTAPQEAGPYARLADALLSPQVREAGFEVTVRDLRTVMLRDPDIALTEKDCSGAVDSMVMAVRPFLAEYEAVESATIRREMIALFRETLNDEEADQLATFYQSENGQKLIAAINANLNFEQTITGSAEGDAEAPVVVKKSDLESDNRRAIAGMLKSLSPEELQEIGTQIVKVPAFARMQELNPKIQALRLDIANRNLIPGFDARMEKAIQEALLTKLDSCGLYAD